MSDQLAQIEALCLLLNRCVNLIAEMAEKMVILDTRIKALEEKIKVLTVVGIQP